MNLKLLVKLSNVVAFVSIVLLLYWVFVFISTQVFGLRIFRENISQTFGMSVLGILALMVGSLMINVMCNLTRIAQKHNQDEVRDFRGGAKKWIVVVLLSFPVLFGLLLAGDYATSRKKENVLVQSARAIVETNSARSERMLTYHFDNAWLLETRDTLEFFERTEKNFPNVSVIVRDTVDGSPVFLAFREYKPSVDASGAEILPEKRQYLLRTTKAERDYLNRVFDENSDEIKFTASDGKYELYYPYAKEGKRIILFFSDYQRYGKLGS